MKIFRAIILVIMFGCSANIHAQHLKDGCAWVYYKWYSTEAEFDEPEYIKYELCGTQELNGKTYYKLYSTTSYWGMVTGPTYCLGLREENSRIYADCDEYVELTNIDLDAPKDSPETMPYVITEDNEVVLYDFNWNVGDYAGLSDRSLRYCVKSKSDIRMETGEERSIFEVYMYAYKSWDAADADYSSYRPHCHVIEGIGATSGLGILYEWLNDLILPYGMDVIEVCLNVFVDNNTLIYKAPDYTGVPEDKGKSYTTYKKDPFFGHLVSGINNVQTESVATGDNCYYDLSGRKLTNGPTRPGLYIRNGKKVVVR